MKNKTNSCNGKMSHPDRKSALVAARLMSDKSRNIYVPYHCRFCDGWHIGGQKKSNRRRKTRMKQQKKSERLW